MTQPCRSRPRVALTTALLGVALSAGGCGDGSQNPPPTAGTDSSPSTAVTSATTPPARSTYDATGLDLCNGTDLTSLDSLSLTVERTDPSPPRSGPGAACLFELRQPGGQPASLRVEATTLATAEEAGRLYRATQGVTGMTPDRTLAGVSEEAEGFTKQSEPGYKYAEYLIHARLGNLVVKVWLAVGGQAFTPKEKLAAVTLSITKATLGAVPKA
jgi:hypothetical protein